MLVFHCVGTIDFFRDKLNKWPSGSENDEAASWRNQCGRLSRPAEVFDLIQHAKDMVFGAKTT